MFEENENVVLETTENTDTQTVEEIEEGIELTDTADVETEKVETEEKKEVEIITLEEAKKMAEDAVEKRLAREKRKYERELEQKLSKYRYLESLVNTGLETNDINEATEKLTSYFKEKGINIPTPQKPGLTQREIEILAKAEAEEIISAGYDEMEAEANRLASKGYQNLDAREKTIFNKLAEELTKEKQKRELVSKGYKAEILEDKEFNNFASKFSPKTSISEIYDLYTKTKGNVSEQTVKPLGSMVNINNETVAKDFYTSEEFDKVVDSNPKLLDDPKFMEIIRKSMQKW